jgi:hypothetical protein
MLATKQSELDAAAKGEGCLGRSQDDEPIFILVARDRTSSKTVRQWVQNAKDAGCTNEAKLEEALALAFEMDKWREAHGGGKVPD